ncbi:hypothetical protein N9Z44_04905 [Mariniblastus sp.]|jgi:hypothetical protein|nr:hypothetical protein [Mariniblastus sp.]
MKKLALISLLVVAIAVLFFLNGEKISEPNQAKSINETLNQICEGKLDITPLKVTYDDSHGFHGGLVLSISGDGSVSQKTERTEIKPPQKQISKDDIQSLVTLLIKEECWAQMTPPRAAVPDESSARLIISYENQETMIWEWFNEMTSNDRIIKIKNHMAMISTEK